MLKRLFLLLLVVGSLATASAQSDDPTLAFLMSQTALTEDQLDDFLADLASASGDDALVADTLEEYGVTPLAALLLVQNLDRAGYDERLDSAGLEEDARTQTEDALARLALDNALTAANTDVDTLTALLPFTDSPEDLQAELELRGIDPVAFAGALNTVLQLDSWQARLAENDVDDDALTSLLQGRSLDEGLAVFGLTRAQLDGFLSGANADTSLTLLQDLGISATDLSRAVDALEGNPEFEALLAESSMTEDQIEAQLDQLALTETFTQYGLTQDQISMLMTRLSENPADAVTILADYGIDGDEAAAFVNDLEGLLDIDLDDLADELENLPELPALPGQ
jgi:hypothetical protein